MSGTMNSKLLMSLALGSLLWSDNCVFGQGTAFTYQGRLNAGGVPANGPYDLTFGLFKESSGGSAVAGPITNTAVAVSNGLFTVSLDFGAGVFTGTPYWLEITARSNSVGTFIVLSPRQALAASPYALYAPTAGGVTDGAITTASIARGSITSNLLAAGAVDATALRSPYQAGRIALDSFTPPPYFAVGMVTQAITFPQPFSSIPIVTATLETSSSRASSAVPPILVSGKSAAGCNLAFHLSAQPVIVALQPSSYFGSGFPLTTVNGRPATAFNGPGGLSYARALDATGQRWGASVSPNQQSRAFELLVVNGNPAIALIDGFNLEFVRANDIDGTTWPAPTVIKTGNSTFQPQGLSFAVIAGAPAIAAWNNASNTIVYFRANDANGATWSTNGLVVATGLNDLKLAQVSGNPALAYCWDNGQPFNSVSHQAEVRYLRASDSTGAAWPASALTLTNVGVIETVSSVRLLVVANNPSIAFVHGRTLTASPQYDLRFVRATDPQGTAWGTRVLAYSTYTYPIQSLSAALVDANPAFAWFDSAWWYAESPNNGANFSRYNIPGALYPPGCLADVLGKPAFTFFGYENVYELVYLRDSNPILDTFIDWIAVQP